MNRGPYFQYMKNVFRVVPYITQCNRNRRRAPVQELQVPVEDRNMETDVDSQGFAHDNNQDFNSDDDLSADEIADIDTVSDDENNDVPVIHALNENENDNNFNNEQNKVCFTASFFF